ncbi:MAG: MotA/TolQ/ExbB proton channel family protein [Thermoguttaceae bacterium]|nr:MotA/TolQ/ExbB proton channel family protein [Thermoguttaceae bacterium]
MSNSMDPFDDDLQPTDSFQLSWKRRDIEQRFGFSGGRYTRVNMKFTGLLALLCTVAFYAILRFFPENHIISMFTDRGIIPYPIVLLGFWTFFILAVKQRKINYQAEPLDRPIIPDDKNFILSPATAEDVIGMILKNADNPKDFLLYRRIVLALSNLKHLGRVSDVDDIIRSQADQDAEAMETSYTIVNGFLWAIPILGFIGTVLGLSDAIGSFGGVLSGSGTDMSELMPALKQVTGGLSTAFETTLIALVIALILQLYSVTVRKREEEFLDDCAEFCTGKIVSRLRMDFNDNKEDK